MPIHYVNDAADDTSAGWDRPMLNEAISILRAVKSVDDLKKARTIVSMNGIVPLDIDQAIKWYYNNPAVAAAHINGPTPDGRPGAIQDLIEIARARGER
jgi:hypothetical protein